MRRVDVSVLAAALLLGGCALAHRRQASGPVFRDPALTVQGARERLEPGRSRKEEVAALLGPAESIRFDSGFEVWAYRAPGERRADAGAELVLLFDPAGVLAKARAVPPRGPGG